MVEESQACSWPFTKSREIFCLFYIYVFNTCMLSTRTYFSYYSFFFYYFLDLFNPNLDLLFLKNAISLPFGQSLAEEIKYLLFFLARFARSVFI